MITHTRPSCAKVGPPKRIADVLAEGERELRGAAAAETPRLDAEVLLADLLGMDRAKLLASYPETVGEHKRREYRSRLARRACGEPVAYITGKKEFMGYTFQVDRRVLIPRPETETLVEHVIGLARKRTRGGRRILDIGTGSGCIAISLALLVPEAVAHATDISTEALGLARANARRHDVEGRVTLHLGSTYEAVPDSLKGSFDFIVSNPPYISEVEYPTLNRAIRHYEPPAALKGGQEGLEWIRRIVGGAAEYLVRGGVLAVEIAGRQAERATEILQDAEGMTLTGVVRDLAGRQRVITGRKTN